MVDLLNIIGTSLRQLAAWLNIDVDVLLIAILAVVVLVFVIMFLALLLATRHRAPPMPARPEARGMPVGMDYIEKTLLEFPAGKVQIEANVERLVFKLAEAEPKIIEKIVEVPAKEKPPVLEQVNIEGAADLNAAASLLCKRFTLESITIADERFDVVSSNSKDPKVDTELARALAPQAGWEVKRVVIKGKPSVYLFPFAKGERKLFALLKGAEKDDKILDLLASELGRLGKFL